MNYRKQPISKKLDDTLLLLVRFHRPNFPNKILFTCTLYPDCCGGFRDNGSNDDGNDDNGNKNKYLLV